MPDHVALHEWNVNVGDGFSWRSVGKVHTGRVISVTDDHFVVSFNDLKWPVRFPIQGPKLSL